MIRRMASLCSLWMVFWLAAGGFLFTGEASSSDPTVTKSITVVMDNNYPPYVFLDAKGNLQGILIDQWRLWEQKTGVKAEINGMDWGEALRRMGGGEFDVIDTIFFNESRARIYDFTKPYAKIDVSIFFHKNISGISDVDSLPGFAVAVKRGDNAIDFLKTKGISLFKEYPSYEAIIMAAKEQKVMVTVIDNPPALYFLYKTGILDQFRHSAPLYTGEFHRAVKKGNTGVLNLVEGGFAKITDGEYQAIQRKWFGTEANLDRTNLRYIAIGLGAFFAIVLLLVVWNRTLRKKVRERTLRLEEEVALNIKNAEALKEAEEKYRSIFENAMEGIYQSTPDGRFLQMNPAMAKIYGYDSPEEMVRIITDIATQIYVNPDDRDLFKEKLKQHGHIEKHEYKVHRKDGALIWVSNNAHEVRDNEGGILYYEGLVQDITQRKQAEEALQTSQQQVEGHLLFLEALLSAMPIPVFYKDADFRYLGCNTAYAEYVGIDSEKIKGKTVYDLWPYELAEMYDRKDRELFQQRGTQTYESKVKVKNGEIRDVIFRKSVFLDNEKSVGGIVGAYFDVTERKQAEDERRKLEGQLIQSQKMEAIGTLAGGIAHDFNNILSGIMGYSELCRNAAHDSAKVRNYMEQVLKATERAKDMVKQILTFSRKVDQEKKPIILAPIVNEAAKFMRASLPTTIEIIQSIDVKYDVIMADPTQMHQVLMNLCTNAGHAMSDAGGVLTIGLKEIVMDDGKIIQYPDLKFGHYLELSVRDTGHGISQDNMGRIFEPYFTTKDEGEGTGMGLAVVHGIVKDHGGEIRVYSELGKGSIFRVYLPLMEKQAEDSADMGETMPPGKGETILFVDDEKMVVDLNRELLEGLGYKVFAETNPFKAIEAFKKDPDAFDLVITDKTMPFLTGFDVAREIRSICGDIPILLCSGFKEKEDMEKLTALGISQLIIKPIGMSVLAKTIRNVLDENK